VLICSDFIAMAKFLKRFLLKPYNNSISLSYLLLNCKASSQYSKPLSTAALGGEIDLDDSTVCNLAGVTLYFSFLSLTASSLLPLKVAKYCALSAKKNKITTITCNVLIQVSALIICYQVNTSKR